MQLWILINCYPNLGTVDIPLSIYVFEVIFHSVIYTRKVSIFPIMSKYAASRDCTDKIS